MRSGVSVLNHDTGFKNMKKDLVQRYGKEAAERIWEKSRRPSGSAVPKIFPSSQRSEGTYTDFIFVNREGGTYYQDTMNKMIRRIIRDCNDEVQMKGEEDPVLLPYFSCHSLRHTFATQMCEAGVNIKVIQETLGHADISNSLNIYADVTKELKKEEFTGLDNFFRDKVICNRHDFGQSLWWSEFKPTETRRIKSCVELCGVNVLHLNEIKSQVELCRVMSIGAS